MHSFTKNCSYLTLLNSYLYSPSDYIFFCYKPLNQSLISFSTISMLNTLLFLAMYQEFIALVFILTPISKASFSANLFKLEQRQNFTCHL